MHPSIDESLEQAKRNLDRTLPKPILDVSIIQANGVVRDLESQATLEAAKSSQTTRSEFKAAKKIAQESIRAFIEELKNRSSTSEFAIGPRQVSTDSLDERQAEAASRGDSATRHGRSGVQS